MPNIIPVVVKTAILAFSVLIFLVLTAPSTAFAAWNDISSNVTITHTDRAIDRVKGTMFSYVTIENASTQDIAGPLRLVVQDSTIAVTGKSGTTESGSPYAIITEESIPAISKIIYRVDFELSRTALSFTPKLEQEVVVEFTPPVFKDFKFVELRGREGHQGYFPVYGKPTFGEGVVEVQIEGDVKDLRVAVVTASETKTFKFNPENIDPEKGYTGYFVDVIIPKEDFSLDISITAPDETVTSNKTSSVTPKGFSISIAKSNHIFSHGQNTLTVIIANKDDDATFEINVEDSENLIKSPFPQTFKIEKGGEAIITVPVNVIQNSNVQNLKFIIKISDLDSHIADEISYDVVVNSDEEPLLVSNNVYKWLAIPGSCEQVSKSATSLKLVVIGTSAVNVNNIDINSIHSFTDQKPTKIEIVDLLSPLGSCSAFTTDGVNDLVLTFDWQKIISAWEKEGRDLVAAGISGIRYDSMGFYLSYKLQNGYFRGFKGRISITN